MTDPMPLQPIRGPQSIDGLTKPPAAKDEDSPSFAEILKSSIQEVNALQKDAEHAVQDLVQGKTENFTEVLTAVEKADLAFKALMQVRNKLLEAYEEINRLRV